MIEDTISLGIEMANGHKLGSCQNGPGVYSTLLAPAKLNLGLRIVGRRPDGYHELQSLFWPLDFADELEISPARFNRLEVSWKEGAPFPSALPPPSENLVAKAMEGLRLPDGRGWDARLTKQIPMGAGLGGGSSDAGAILRYLGETLGIDETQLLERARKLGADVPFFLKTQPAWVSGIGEKREYLELAPGLAEQVHFLLVLLPEAVPTQRVFAEYRAAALPFSTRREKPTTPLTPEGLRRHLKDTGNDLEAAATRVCPLIGRVLEALRQTPSLYAGLSGSGSTCFAVFDSPDARERCVKDLMPFLRRGNCRNIRAETFNRA